MQSDNIQSFLYDWYMANARDLPWRKSKNPYNIWISEIMLQQTRVETVIPYYNRFIKELPTISDLANVDDEELYKLWQGLGYYSRARNLKKAAKKVLEAYGGTIPNTIEELVTLPGIGLYTAGAIASIAYDKPVPAVDGNVMRVMTRIYRKKLDITTQAAKKEISEIIKNLIPPTYPGTFNQALMELGATICIPNGKPKCDGCPIHSFCLAFNHHEIEDIPVKKIKKSRLIQNMAVFLVKIEDGWLLHKRAKQGLLADLWEFPNLLGDSSDQEIKDYLLSHHIQVSQVKQVAKAKHIFTHLEWQMNIYLVEGKLLQKLENNVVIATKTQIKDQYSIPTAFSPCIKIIT